MIGQDGEFRYGHEYLGAGTDTLAAVADGSNGFAEKLKAAKNPMIIVGQGALKGANGAAVLAAAAKIAADCGAVTDEWNGFAVLHTAASRVGALDLGFVPGEGGADAATQLASMDVLFLLGADELDFSAKKAASRSISAAMATPAHLPPTSSCRALPIRKSPAPGSIPKAASR